MTISSSRLDVHVAQLTIINATEFSGSEQLNSMLHEVELSLDHFVQDGNHGMWDTAYIFDDTDHTLVRRDKEFIDRLTAMLEEAGQHIMTQSASRHPYFMVTCVPVLSIVKDRLLVWIKGTIILSTTPVRLVSAQEADATLESHERSVTLKDVGFIYTQAMHQRERMAMIAMISHQRMEVRDALRSLCDSSMTSVAGRAQLGTCLEKMHEGHWAIPTYNADAAQGSMAIAEAIRSPHTVRFIDGRDRGMAHFLATHLDEHVTDPEDEMDGAVVESHIIGSMTVRLGNTNPAHMQDFLQSFHHYLDMNTDDEQTLRNLMMVSFRDEILEHPDMMQLMMRDNITIHNSPIGIQSIRRGNHYAIAFKVAPSFDNPGKELVALLHQRSEAFLNRVIMHCLEPFQMVKGSTLIASATSMDMHVDMSDPDE